MPARGRPAVPNEEDLLRPGIPTGRTLDAYLVVLDAMDLPADDRALAYAVLHQVQLRINRRLRVVQPELVEHMVRENLRALGPVTIRTSAIDPKWPANDPENWEDATMQQALENLAADPALAQYVRRVPAHLEIDTQALGADVHAGEVVARALWDEANAKRWRTEEGRRLGLQVRTPSGVTL